MKNKIIYIISVSFGIILFVIVAIKDNTTNDDTIKVSVYDNQMNEAIRNARDTLPVFINQLSKARKTQIFLIKVRFSEDYSGEHMWVKNVQYDGNKYFSGVLNNKPVSLKKYSFGQHVRFTKDDVSDWVIISDGTTSGGYTNKVIRNINNGI
jgi:uncharacterized protein YegJ (DUF2314 family)